MISSSEWNQDLGMQMDVEIQDIVMADLNTDSSTFTTQFRLQGYCRLNTLMCRSARLSISTC